MRKPGQPREPNQFAKLTVGMATSQAPRIAAWLALAILVTACAAGPPPDGAPSADTRRYAGPPSWDPARGVFIDPFSGHPVRGGGR